MNRLFIIILLIFSVNPANLFAQEDKTLVYLVPGQGADYRLYKNLELDSSFLIRNINHIIPEKGWSMRDYAETLSQQIDTTRKFIIIGVSFGGMLATEMNEFLRPAKTIIISSAKSQDELPWHYTFQKKIPIYKIVPGSVSKLGAMVLQPLVEPASKQDKETFRAMLKDKNPDYMKRTIAMIIEWDKENYNEDIIHIHGEKDHTLPVRNVKYNYLIEEGSHMIVLTKGEEISELVNGILINN
ncbi:MAG: alpha/beta hydrolase [Bacteroidota bacterium]